MLELAKGLVNSGVNQLFSGNSPESALRKLQNLEKRCEGDSLLQSAVAATQSVLKALMDGDVEQGRIGLEQFRLIEALINTESHSES